MGDNKFTDRNRNAVRREEVKSKLCWIDRQTDRQTGEYTMKYVNELYTLGTTETNIVIF